MFNKKYLIKLFIFLFVVLLFSFKRYHNKVCYDDLFINATLIKFFA